MRKLLDKIETRQRLVRATAERLRDQIARLTEQLTAAENTLRRLEITHQTIREPAAEDGAPPPEPLPSGYREILAAIEEAEEGLRAKDICQALGLGTEPRHTESARAKLKRLVGRGILAEPEPGLFTHAKPTPAAPEANSH
ncbi:hypothetical protein [Streptomyces chattanoogensis]|uniref:Uncharacterized protein n=1 Tax=Streptomyces chattanoogensis TaxID=66876 RepID=A0A0N0GVB3_9ACTN|nr:hypothetical protein [Streptomyces chattanoogensis]KPC59129.1 hypothetical protein ADL29_36335 [Streptomyces chattanoogensis]